MLLGELAGGVAVVDAEAGSEQAIVEHRRIDERQRRQRLHCLGDVRDPNLGDVARVVLRKGGSGRQRQHGQK